MKLIANSQSRAFFVENSEGNPLQILIPANVTLEEFELSEEQVTTLIAGGADAATLESGVREAEQIDCEIVARLAGGEGSLGGQKSTVFRFVCRRFDNPAQSLTTVIAVPDGERVPEEGDTVTINRYPTPGLYYNRSGRSTSRPESLMYCKVPGFTPGKISRVEATTEEQIRKQVLLAERDAARKRAASVGKATTEA